MVVVTNWKVDQLYTDRTGTTLYRCIFMLKDGRPVFVQQDGDGPENVVLRTPCGRMVDGENRMGDVIREAQ